MATHLRDTGHKLCESAAPQMRKLTCAGVDAKSGSVFCSACDNLVLLARLEREFVQSTLAVDERVNRAKGLSWLTSIGD